MGYGAYEPQAFVGLRRFSDHETDVDTVSHWTFNGDDTDQVGSNDQNGLASNVCYAPCFGLSADKRTALAVNATNNYGVNIPTVLKTLTSLTVACWYCPTEHPIQNAAIFGFRLPGSSGDPNDFNFPWVLDHVSTGETQLLWQHGNKIGAGVTGPVLTLNRWVHISATRNAAQTVARIYINGVRFAEATGLTPPNGGSSITDLVFGYDGGTEAVRAMLATAIVKDVEINDAEAAQLYRSALSTSPLMLPVFGESTFSGDASNVTFGTPPAIFEFDNQIPGAPAQLNNASVSFQPTQVTKAGKTAFNCGDSSFLDMFQGPGLLNEFITDNAWHIFTVVSFDQITALSSEDPAHQHLLFGTFGGHFALTLHDDTSVKYAQGFANNGTSDLSARAVIPTAQYALVEYWNDGSDIGIRVDDGSEVTTGWTGNVPGTSGGMGTQCTVGSTAFNGGWDFDENVMAELHVYDGFLSPAKRAAMRNYLGQLGYGFSV